MPIRLTQADGNLTVYLQGEIDHHGARSIMLALDREVAARDPRTLTADLSEVTFMDSSGIAVLLRAFRRVQECGGTMTVRRVPPQAGKVLSAAGLERIIPIDETM